MSLNTYELLLYGDGEETKTLHEIAKLMRSTRRHEMTDATIADEKEQTKRLYRCLSDLIRMAGECGFSGNLWHIYLTRVLVGSVNSFSLQAERRDKVLGSVNEIALQDLTMFYKLFHFSFERLNDIYSVPALSQIGDYVTKVKNNDRYNADVRARIETLAKELAECADAAQMKERLSAFYERYGVGDFGVHRAFRVRYDEALDAPPLIEPVRNLPPVTLDDLVGYEIAKKKLVENTEAFLRGQRANNCLLYGDAGTGKSTSIKALANTYYERGLRVIELYKHQMRALVDVIDQIKSRNYRFIVYMDDLSFEDFETEYKYLKALIEGGLSARPENVLIYATSNRRHLIRESFKDKPQLLDDDIHRNDTVNEKLSLAHRFGVTIYYGVPDKDGYLEIVKALAKRAGIRMEEKALLEEAIRFEMLAGNRSGRTAQHFVDLLQGKQDGEQ